MPWIIVFAHHYTTLFFNMILHSLSLLLLLRYLTFLYLFSALFQIIFAIVGGERRIILTLYFRPTLLLFSLQMDAEDECKRTPLHKAASSHGVASKVLLEDMIKVLRSLIVQLYGYCFRGRVSLSFPSLL